MTAVVTSGSYATCTCGTTPAELLADYDTGATVSDMIVMTVDMIVSEVNIMSFGDCDSLINPEVSDATAAAGGVTTPMPCVPVVASDWTTGSLTASQDGIAYITDTSTCTCSYGGVITISEALGTLMETP